MPGTETSSPAPQGASDYKPTWRRPYLWGFVLVLIAIDLWSKQAVFAEVGLGAPAEPIAGNWLSFYCILNSGGIWGLGNDGSVTGLLTIVRLIAVGVLLLFIRNQERENKAGLFTLSLLLAGAVGNLYDNLSAWLPWEGNGHVRDFVMVYFDAPGWWPWQDHWPLDPFPIFNFADACISVGFLMLIFGLAHLRLHPRG